MQQTNPYNHYLKVAVESASQTRLIVMLYDGAIRFLSQAVPAMHAKNFEAQHNFISNAQAIIAHLRATLDFEAGGEVARALDSVYVPMYDMLTAANVYDMTHQVERVIEVLRELREAWVEVDRQMEEKKQTALDSAQKRELIAA